jgi:hypothetical protein
MVEGRFRLPRGAGCCLGTDIENVAPFSGKIIICLQYLVLVHAQAAQSYPVLLITLYLYINSILKIIRKSCVINLLRYIFI